MAAAAILDFQFMWIRPFRRVDSVLFMFYLAVVHLPMKFGADTFIQSGVIDIFRKLKMVAAAILDLFGWAMGPPT